MDNKTYTFDYFISYRRESGGYEYAKKIRGILMKYGKRVIVSKNNLKEGKYPEILQKVIENTNAFVLILNEDSWRQNTEIDVYYEEIIRIAKTKRNILTIEYVSGTLRNIPQILTDELAKENCKLSDFEKITVCQNQYYNFEEELCSKIGVAYQVIDPNLPKFTMSKLDSLIDRDKVVDAVYDRICNHRFYNIAGIGGSGKTSLTYLLAKKYGDDLVNIAYVVVNGNIKEDFAVTMNNTLKNCEDTDSTDEKYKKVFAELKKNYSIGNNLVVLDIKEMSDKIAITDFLAGLRYDFSDNWKVIILSREKIGDYKCLNLNENDDAVFLKDLFLKKTDNRYKDFEDFDQLWEVVYYNPLLTEQLGIYLRNLPKTKTLEEIEAILYGDKFRGKQRVGINTFQCGEKDDKTIICFLQNLVNYQDFTPDEQKLLRHFVLWKSEFIQYKIIEDLLRDVCEDLDSALSSLSERSIFSVEKDDKSQLSYKLHSLLADSLREQIDVTKQDYETYINNIFRIRDYKFREFMPYADCIGNSLSEYDITTWFDLLNDTATKFYETWKTDYAKKLYEKCIEISNQRLESEPENIEYLEDLSGVYNNLANLQQDRLNNYKSAEKNYNKAIEIREEIRKVSDKPEYLNLLAKAYSNLASLQKNQERYDSAIENCKKAIEIYAIVKDTNLAYLVYWMVSKDMLAQLYIATYKPTDARAILDEIKPQAKKLLKEYPGYGYLEKVYAWILFTEGMMNEYFYW